MKKYDIKNTDKETLQKWFYLMTLGRALNRWAGRIMLPTPDMMGFSLRSGRFSKREKISCSLITGTCSPFYRQE